MPKLLLADDSPTTQKVVQLTFADEGIDVVVAADGDAAMELFDHHKPDIVLADINIPGLNGYEVCEAIRRRESQSKTPVVLLAGSFEPFDVEAAHRVGANDYLTKPFSSIRRLVATVTALLDTVARADETAHDTVEPIGETPSVETSMEPADPMPAPGSKPVDQEEPDMFSTSDIDHLYTESVVEQPGDIENADAVSEVPVEAENTFEEAAVARLEDSAFDDELIETTYLGNGAENGQADAAEPTAEHAPASTTVSLPHIPLPAGELPANTGSIPQSQIPTVSFEVRPAAEPYEKNEKSPFPPGDVEFVQPLEYSDEGNTAPTQTDASQLDQSGDETYFEPAGDQNNETPLLPAQLSEVNAVEQIPVGSSGSVETPSHEQINDHGELPPAIDEHTNVEALPANASTPWDSVATDDLHRPLSDDANLLEVPYQYREHSELTNKEAITVNPSDYAGEISPEVVERIAQLTAAQISEEMVREIAKRVVPQIIEEVLRAKAAEE